MKSPLQVTYRHMRPSDAVTARIGEETAKLEEFYARITSCHVVVEAPHRHHKWGELFHVRIDLGVPGSELVVSHEPARHATLDTEEKAFFKKHIEAHPEHKDVHVAVRDAFARARRQLQDYVKHLRGDEKPRARLNDVEAH